MSEPAAEHCPVCGHLLDYTTEQGWYCLCGWSDRQPKEAA